jgi:citrate lyase synthetase
VRPHGQLVNPITFDYCTECARPEHESKLIGATSVSEMVVAAKAWVDGHEYSVEKTIKELDLEAAGNR